VNKVPTKNGEEYDIVSRWRRVICWGRGEVKRIKQRMNRRDRRQSKQKLRRR